MQQTELNESNSDETESDDGLNHNKKTKLSSSDNVTNEECLKEECEMIEGKVNDISDCDENDLYECVTVCSGDSDNDSDDDSSAESSLNSSDEENIFSDEECNEEEKTLKDKLQDWAVSSSVPHTQIEKLLGIIKPVVKDLPKSSKTFLGSTSGTSYTIEEFPSSSKNPKAKSEFVYFGITEHLQRVVNVMAHINFILVLQFFIDALPLYKSSNVQFWPILGRIVTAANLYEPFVVACYCGQEKPSSQTLYFDRFIKEMNMLLTNGILIDGYKFGIKLMCFLADRPARAFSKAIINHGGFFACERCLVKGITFHNKRVYASLDKNLRSDKSFREYQNLQHHKGFSPLCKLQPKLDMI